LHQYQQGGLEKVKEVNLAKRQSQLNEHRASIESYFRQHPPATIAEASAKIAELTGIKRGPTQIRHFLTSLGMKPRKVGQIPAKADVEAQEKFKTQLLEPKLAEAQAGNRMVFGCSPFCLRRLFGIGLVFSTIVRQSSSSTPAIECFGGYQRYHKRDLHTQNLTYITAQTVCELLRILAASYPKVPITVILDNARYQRCALVQTLAQSLNIELLFLPAYSPNLNLIERFWKFVKKKCLYSKYYVDCDRFQQAILDCIQYSPTKYKDELESLLTFKFQTFKEVAVIGDQPKLCPFSMAKPMPKKVSSKAA
jgi:transposase